MILSPPSSTAPTAHDHALLHAVGALHDHGAAVPHDPGHAGPPPPPPPSLPLIAAPSSANLAAPALSTTDAAATSLPSSSLPTYFTGSLLHDPTSAAPPPAATSAPVPASTIDAASALLDHHAHLQQPGPAVPYASANAHSAMTMGGLSSALGDHANLAVSTPTNVAGTATTSALGLALTDPGLHPLGQAIQHLAPSSSQTLADATGTSPHPLSRAPSPASALHHGSYAHLFQGTQHASVPPTDPHAATLPAGGRTSPALSTASLAVSTLSAAAPTTTTLALQNGTPQPTTTFMDLGLSLTNGNLHQRYLHATSSSSSPSHAPSPALASVTPDHALHASLLPPMTSSATMPSSNSLTPNMHGVPRPAVLAPGAVPAPVPAPAPMQFIQGPNGQLFQVVPNTTAPNASHQHQHHHQHHHQVQSMMAHQAQQLAGSAHPTQSTMLHHGTATAAIAAARSAAHLPGPGMATTMPSSSLHHFQQQHHLPSMPLNQHQHSHHHHHHHHHASSLSHALDPTRAQSNGASGPASQRPSPVAAPVPMTGVVSTAPTTTDSSMAEPAASTAAVTAPVPEEQLPPAPPAAEEPLYVNAKQYHRILKRRAARARIEAELKGVRQRKPYLHESRHKHAMRRPRGPGGRFLTKAEMEEMEAKGLLPPGTAAACSSNSSSRPRKRKKMDDDESMAEPTAAAEAAATSSSSSSPSSTVSSPAVSPVSRARPVEGQ
ncbi:hypothetical protein AMAG_13812 [Allomyces macrogynus ATCC 38327]|uniref:Transcriptional activator HAP2 n=1 Tax=Allomyces macrogynus (strain ATCC 38327) TaxID=578462 RepID=A0A0L0T425_ALLM3|nr:hypothetical protein AMAG_13812 [Allomyces macrogynus ATCC 38327]|eukprot:KNE69456.1 hypothetical protein AMAG_13812 [Allomyces macrogynus ATCC 38327]